MAPTTRIRLRSHTLRSPVSLGLFLAFWCGNSHAQTPNPAASPEPEGKHTGAPLAQFNVGPFQVTPTFRIGNLIVDTNIQYERDRKTDFLASAGPGLDIALPFRDHWKLDLQGGSQYLYFLRTKGLRRWTGGGTATLFWATTGTRASLSTGLSREFSRPSFEVDRRVAATQATTAGTFERDLGRLTLTARAFADSNEVDAGQDFRGADLSASLSANRYRVEPGLQYRLTPLSSLLLVGSYESSRFSKASSRNFHSEEIGVGLQTAGLFKGRVLGGVRRSQLVSGQASNTQPFFRLSLTQSRQLGRRLRLSGEYSHESTISAFAADGGLPTIEQRSASVGLTIDVTKRMDLSLRGQQTKLKSGGLVVVILDDGSLGKAKRDDVVYVGDASIGIRLGRARVGAFVSYTTRQSQYFSDFGIEGIQAGARVEYAPRF
jgi:hypothetical protein